MTNIAFIGLGIMGSPMAVHLANAGHTVAGFNRTPERAKPLVDAGGRDPVARREPPQVGPRTAIGMHPPGVEQRTDVAGTLDWVARALRG